MTHEEYLELKEQKDIALENANKVEKEAGNKLLDFLQTLTIYKLKLTRFHLAIWDKNFYGEIAFVKEDGKEDFGSYITISVSDKLELNCGTCGAFTKADIYQIERCKMVVKMFKNEEQIIDLMRDYLINASELDNIYYDLSHKVRDYEYALQKEQQEQEYKKMLKQLKVMNFLAIVDKKQKYNIETQKYEYDYFYAQFYKIDKITKKMVYTHRVDSNFTYNRKFRLTDLQSMYKNQFVDIVGSINSIPHFKNEIWHSRYIVHSSYYYLHDIKVSN